MGRRKKKRKRQIIVLENDFYQLFFGFYFMFGPNYHIKKNYIWFYYEKYKKLNIIKNLCILKLFNFYVGELK